MTDAELNKAVADACGIDVYEHEFLGLCIACEYHSRPRKLNPANDWNDAMRAMNTMLEKMLYSRRQRFYEAIQDALPISGGIPAWPDVLMILAMRGPRAICEAILAVTKKEA